MQLAPREEPQAGFDALILGSIYHLVLEQLYQRVPDGDPDRLRAQLPDVARQVFDAAPASYGFRPTPLWEYQKQELTGVLRRTLEGLLTASQGCVPLAQELPFGLHDRPPLILEGAPGTVQLRGYIDRVDTAPDGGLRIIDYKAGSTPITARDLADGRRLQLPLYALAATRALGVPVTGGFYWHIDAAEPSKLELERFAGGVTAAIETAVAHALAISAAVCEGQFAPRPPSEGCPASCPATAFCERYVSKGW
jgi:ATP-dependent helicase/DNAse subunit B